MQPSPASAVQGWPAVRYSPGQPCSDHILVLIVPVAGTGQGLHLSLSCV